MNSPHQSLRLALCLALTASVHADESGSQPQLIFTPGTSDIWNADWAGVTQRTYFFQWSEDLVTWHFAPFVEFSSGVKSYGMQTQNVEKLFVRLRYVDAPWISTLQEAKDADFDGDAIPNLFEVETLSSDPLNSESHGGDTDGDGLFDGWEELHWGNTTEQGSGGNPDGDSLSNMEEQDLGLNPRVKENEAVSGKTTLYTYDNSGRLTNVTAPKGTVTLVPDAEGNILNAQ
jgi:YD repeat-containing protein